MRKICIAMTSEATITQHGTSECIVFGTACGSVRRQSDLWGTTVVRQSVHDVAGRILCCGCLAPAPMAMSSSHPSSSFTGVDAGTDGTVDVLAGTDASDETTDQWYMRRWETRSELLLPDGTSNHCPPCTSVRGMGHGVPGRLVMAFAHRHVNIPPAGRVCQAHSEWTSTEP